MGTFCGTIIGFGIALTSDYAFLCGEVIHFSSTQIWIFLSATTKKFRCRSPLGGLGGCKGPLGLTLRTGWPTCWSLLWSSGRGSRVTPSVSGFRGTKVWTFLITFLLVLVSVGGGDGPVRLSATGALGTSRRESVASSRALVTPTVAETTLDAGPESRLGGRAAPRLPASLRVSPAVAAVGC